MVYGEVADSDPGRAAAAVPAAALLRDDAVATPTADRLTQFAQHTLCARRARSRYHHHMGAYVEAPADVDELMSVTGAEVGLLFDSGHMTFAGGDAVDDAARSTSRASATCTARTCGRT